MNKIGGAYPGGPRRRDPEDPDSDEKSGVRLRSAEEIEARSQRYRSASEKRRRRKRVMGGVAAALVVAGGVGFWLGVQSNRTTEDIAAEQRETADEGFDLTQERNLILDQLWLMEDLERARRP